ncbi:MAG TPA: hypothetical protein VGG46_11500 [Terriglobales bacterium]
MRKARCVGVFIVAKAANLNMLRFRVTGENRQNAEEQYRWQVNRI